MGLSYERSERRRRGLVAEAQAELVGFVPGIGAERPKEARERGAGWLLDPELD